MKTVKIQQFGATTVTTARTSTGQRAAKINKPGLAPYAIPAEICALAAGKDEWMRDIQFPCDGCGSWTKASALFDELPGSCPACSEKYFRCDKCKGTHHPDDQCEG